MEKYHKIQTVFKRDVSTKYKTLLVNDYSLPEFEYLKDCEWVFTEKVDGTNIRVMFENGQLLFGGKTDNSQMPVSLMVSLANTFSVESMQSVFDDSNVCLYGEGYGAKIQKGGGNYRPDQGFVLFDIKIDGWWIERYNVEAVASKLDIPVVPVIGRGPLDDMVDMCRSGFVSTWGNFQAEGIVARPKCELKSRSGSRIITKLKCTDF